MKNLIFSWGDNKNSENVRKHGVSFEEAQTVFFDEKALEFEDPDHSETEDRFLLLDLSQKLRVLVICHCFRKTESEIRIISVRKATAKEQKVYYKVFR